MADKKPWITLFVFADLYLLQVAKFNVSRFTWKDNYLLLTLLFILANTSFFILERALAGDHPRPADQKNKLSRIVSNKYFPIAFFLIFFLALLYFSSRHAFAVYRYAYFCEKADMLLVIEGSLARLTRWQNPFLYSYCFGAPLVYLPLLVVAYLPAYLLHLDIRFISILSLLAGQLLIFKYFLDRHSLINAFCVPLLLAGMPLMPFLIFQIQDFPILLLFILLFYFFKQKKIGAAYFLAGLLLGTKHTFLVMIPLMAIYLWKDAELTNVAKKRIAACFLAGVVLSYSFAFIHIGAFLRAQIGSMNYFNRPTAPDVFLVNAIGFFNIFSRFTALRHIKIVFTVLELLLSAGLYGLALRHLNHKNFNFFMFWIFFIFFAFIPFRRSEEYYYLILLIPLIFSLPEKSPQKRINTPILHAATAVGLLLLLFFPVGFYAKKVAPHSSRIIRLEYGFTENGSGPFLIENNQVIFSFPLNLGDFLAKKIELGIKCQTDQVKIQTMMVNDQTFPFHPQQMAEQEGVVIEKKYLRIGNNRITLFLQGVWPQPIRLSVRKTAED